MPEQAQSSHAPPTLDSSTVANPATSQQVLISLRGIWKVFDGVAVLQGVSLELRKQEIHALLGGNGSGKSTLMKILSGVYSHDAGTIEIEGSPAAVASPADGHRLGIYLVPQEPQIFPHLSVEENLLIGSELTAHAARTQIKELAEELGFGADLQEAAGALSIANQQLLEIIRGLLRNARVLIFDEPTSALTFREVQALFALMRKLAARGIGIFFISHRLNEILEIADRVSVLRDGKLVLSAPRGKLTTRELIQAMLPETSSTNGSNGTAVTTANASERAVLEIKNLDGNAFHEISFRVECGEVVGLAGVVGAGRTELAFGILGIDPHVRGEVWVNGQLLTHRNPRQCLDAGLVYVPEDRHAHGIFMGLPNYQTTTAAILPRLGRLLLSPSLEAQVSQQFVDQLEIKVSDLSQLARTLSGGNQQKVVLAKWLAASPRAIILDEPTRGVDAKARQDVYHLIHQLTARGVGVLLISSDLEEIVELSDRVLVIYRGTLLEELPRSRCQIDQITAAAFGVRGGT